MVIASLHKCRLQSYQTFFLHGHAGPSLTCIMAFIDKSGTTSKQDRLFTTAAVWCVPTIKEGYQSVLNPTARCVWKTIRASSGKKQNETRYASGLRRYVDILLFILGLECYNDTTMVGNERHWAGHPISFTMSTLHPNIEDRMMFKSNVNLDFALRLRSIISLLRLLFLYRGNSNYKVSVFLDEIVMATSGTYYGGKHRHIPLLRAQQEGIWPATYRFNCWSDKRLFSAWIGRKSVC